MIIVASSSRASRGPSLVSTILTFLAALSYSSLSAQAPPVPAEYQTTYSSLNTYLANFNTTLNTLPPSNVPLLSTAALTNADANAGPQLVNPGTMAGLQLQLNELQAMGVQAVMVEVGFPMLYAPRFSPVRDKPKPSSSASISRLRS